MRRIILGKSGIETPQNAFGALPLQRTSSGEAVAILRRALDGGMTFYDTARGYSDSESKIGEAFAGVRDDVILATKTRASTPRRFWNDLHESLRTLGTDRIDLYQFHCADRCIRPEDGSGLYEAMAEAVRQGKVLHVGITTHKVHVAEEVVASGLYETLQFPFSYISSDRDLAMADACARADMGLIAMKGLAGGLLTNAAACMAFMSQYANVLPIWGIQRMQELEQWLGFFDGTPTLNEDIRTVIDKDRKELMGYFCRGCGYCAPCTVGIIIDTCARISQLLKRAPAEAWLSEKWQDEMDKIPHCIGCMLCRTRCPYELDIPDLLRRNYADYIDVLQRKARHVPDAPRTPGDPS